jgi:hypothetical protein
MFTCRQQVKHQSQAVSVAKVMTLIILNKPCKYKLSAKFYFWHIRTPMFGETQKKLQKKAVLLRRFH